MANHQIKIYPRNCETLYQHLGDESKKIGERENLYIKFFQQHINKITRDAIPAGGESIRKKNNKIKLYI